MKKLILILALVVSAAFADAQGTIQFANNAGTRLTIFGVRPLNASMGGPAAGTFTIGVFAGLTADSLSSQPVGDLGYNTAIGGLIGSPNGNAHQLPGFLPDALVFIQIRCWESRFGLDWRAAQQIGFFGQTEVREVRLGPASGPGTVIWSSTDLTKFQAINWVPEPSAITLGLLGLGGLLLFRSHRRKTDCRMSRCVPSESPTKKLLLTLALSALATFADAQGTIQFANGASTRFFINGVRPLNASMGGPAAGTFTFGVFAGLTADSLSNEPVGDLGHNTAIGGLISSPNPQAHQLPGFAPGSTAFIEIRGWESRFGSDWRAGFAGGLWMVTPIKSFVLGPASGPGTVIWGADDLTKLQFPNIVPEPSAIALALFGLGGLLLIRRRSNSDSQMSRSVPRKPQSRVS